MTARFWPSYAAVWRWHFYAGLFCVPFILWLAITGSIYLFRPQIEAVLDAPYAQVAGTGPRASAAAQAAAAVRAVPGSVLHRFELPQTRAQAIEVIVGNASGEARVHVHPQTLAILKVEDEDSRPMMIVFRLHGELLAGNPGSYVVELAASWAIVMILTGLFLWWPRGRGLAGTLWPRLGSRWRWRDLHAVTGLWVSGFALVFLFSGLPWAKSWGDYLQLLRSAVPASTGAPDWAAAGTDALRARAMADRGTRVMLGAHSEHGGLAMAHPRIDYSPLDRLAHAVQPMGLAPPVLLAPPTGPGEPWTVKSDAANRPLRTSLTLDGRTGEILSREEFRDRPLIDRAVGYGVAAHEGQLFGAINQLINLLIALGLMLLAVSSVILWWRRRPGDTLGAPPALIARPAARGFVALLAGLGLILPLLGVSMVTMLVVERYILRRMPGPARWLGLQPV